MLDVPKALGKGLTIYDPRLDPGLVGAGRWVDLLAAVLAER